MVALCIISKCSIFRFDLFYYHDVVLNVTLTIYYITIYYNYSVIFTRRHLLCALILTLFVLYTKLAKPSYYYTYNNSYIQNSYFVSTIV